MWFIRKIYSVLTVSIQLLLYDIVLLVTLSVRWIITSRTFHSAMSCQLNRFIPDNVLEHSLAHCTPYLTNYISTNFPFPISACASTLASSVLSVVVRSQNRRTSVWPPRRQPSTTLPWTSKRRRKPASSSTTTTPRLPTRNHVMVIQVVAPRDAHGIVGNADIDADWPDCARRDASRGLVSDFVMLWNIWRCDGGAGTVQTYGIVGFWKILLQCLTVGCDVIVNNFTILIISVYLLYFTIMCENNSLILFIFYGARFVKRIEPWYKIIPFALPFQMNYQRNLWQTRTSVIGKLHLCIARVLYGLVAWQLLAGWWVMQWRGMTSWHCLRWHVIVLCI